MTKTNMIVGGNGFATINEALKAASEQTLIRVMPGIYRESLVINKNVTIEGVGKVEEIVLIGPEKSAISSIAKHARIQNITLKQLGRENSCVEISNGKIHIEGCDISGGRNCVIIHGAKSAPTLKNNRIHDAKFKDQTNEIGQGIYLYENAAGVIEENEIFENSTNGIGLNFGADPVVRNNRILKNKWSGISVNKSNGIFEENEVFENGSNGISIYSEADPLVCNNQILKNTDHGIWIYNMGCGTIEKNEIFENENDGVHIILHSAPMVRNNRILKNKKNGITIEKSGGVIEENEIVENVNGIWITSGDSIVHRNLLLRNIGYGIFIFESDGIIEQNTSVGNAHPGMRLSLKGANHSKKL